MSETPIYGTTELQSNSANADVVVNAMVTVIENAANVTKEWTVASDFTITQAEFAEGFFHDLGGSPSSPFAFGVPTVDRFFGVRNSTSQTCTIYVQGQSGAGVSVSAGAVALLRSDGVNIENVVGGAVSTTAAANVTYDNTLSTNIYSNNVQEALDELSAQVGGSSSSGGVVRKATGFANVGTDADTLEKTLQSYTLPGGTLATNGQSVRIKAIGTLAATTRARSVRLYFGATVLASIIGATNSGTLNWCVEAVVVRSGAATQVGAGETFNNFPVASFTTTGPTETLSGDILLRVTGQSSGAAVANDVACSFFQVEFLP